MYIRKRSRPGAIRGAEQQDSKQEEERRKKKCAQGEPNGRNSDVSLVLPISQARTLGYARLRHVTKEGGLAGNWGEIDQLSSSAFFFALGLVPMSAYSK